MERIVVGGGELGQCSRGERRVILYLVETPGQFTELERLTRLLEDRRPVSQIYLVYDCGDVTEAIRKRIEAVGAVCANASHSTADRALRGAADASSGLGKVVRYFRDLIHLPVFAARYRRLLRERLVDLVVVAEDNVGGRSRALIAAADRLGIPAMLVPFTIVNPDEAAAAVRHVSSLQVRRPDQRAFAALRPRWMRQSPGGDLLRLPLGKAMMLELAGLAPPDPWIDGRGPATVAAESRAMQRHYLAMGFSPVQIALTGSLVDTVLEDGLRRRDELRAGLLRRLGLPDKPVLLCALPPDQFRLGPPAECAYGNYQLLISDLLSSLASVAGPFAVVVRPHPRSTSLDLEQLRRLGIAVAPDDTAELIPLCDLYVASSSATIRWAIACGRPVLNYDVYRYNYDDYIGLPGVVRVDSAQAFDGALGELAAKPDRLWALAEAQAAVSGEWGCLDGGSEGRLLALYDGLLARRAGEPR